MVDSAAPHNGRVGVNMSAVLTLSGDAYVAHRYGRGEAATSPFLAGFAAEVDAVFDAPPAAP